MTYRGGRNIKILCRQVQAAGISHFNKGLNIT